MASTRGRKRTLRAAEEFRDRIDSTSIMKTLQSHVDGKKKLSNTQISAAKILLAKTMPDLKAIEQTGHIDIKQVVTQVKQVIVRVEGK